MLDYFRLFLQLVFAISVMYMLLDCKEKLKKNRYKIGFYTIAVIICDVLIFHRLGYTRFLSMYPLLVQLPVFLAFVFVSKFKLIKVFFVHLTVIAITLSITAAGVFIAYYFGRSKSAVNIACYIMYLPVWYVIYKHIRPTFLYMLRNTEKGWIGFCIIPLSYTLLLYSISAYDLNLIATEPITWTVVLYFALVISAYYMILRYFKLTREQLTLQSEQDILKGQVFASKMRLEALKESQEKTLIYSHDMRHHLNLISAYLKDNNIIAAQTYIAEVGSAIEDAAVPIYCANYSVNLILYAYIAKAEKDNINVRTQIDLSENRSIPDMDLCVIFANAIENATNACNKIPNTKDRLLTILCKSNDGKLFIEITNTFDGSVIFVDGMPVCTSENHGLGTKSIVAVSEKHGGLCSFTAIDGLFKLCIILQPK